MADMDLRAFICGYPASHSRSPLIHNYWLQHYGIAGVYERCEIAPDQFIEFVKGLQHQGYAGGNITMPHKEVAFSLLEHKDEAVSRIGAANTLWFEDGKLCGTNTDGYGFAANLDEQAPGWDQGNIVTLLGAGGASRAIIYALKKRGFKEIRIVNRTISRAKELSQHFGGTTSFHGFDSLDELLTDTDVLINTTSLGMEGGDTFSFNLDPLPDSALVTDIVYVPLETPILKLARQRGLNTVDGLGMLLHQAVPGFEHWFGHRPEVTADLRNLLLADMGNDQ